MGVLPGRNPFEGVVVASPRTLPAAGIEPRPVTWIWESYLPLAMPSLLVGWPGEGKSTVATYLAARVSREGRAVVLASAEDDPARIIRPRLEAAGADLELVHIWDLRAAPLELPDGAQAFGEELARHGAALGVLDPLNAFIGLDVNSHRDHHIRRVLAPLAEVAADTGAAVLAVGHLNKSGAVDPLARVSGSIAYVAAVRQVLLATTDPSHEDRRILAPIKSNVAGLAPPLAYRLERVELPGGIWASRAVWLGEAPEADVRSLLAPASREERTLAVEAAEVLRAVLADGPRPAREVEREVREAIGEVSHGLIVKARRLAGVAARKSGFSGGWEWFITEGSREESRSNPSDRDSSVRPAETGVLAPEESRLGECDSSEPRAPSVPTVRCPICGREAPWGEATPHPHEDLEEVL